jgi:hypothetical protein
VLVQGRCRPVRGADPDWNRDVLGPASARFMGPQRQGFFWDRWLLEYNEDRVAVTVDVERLVVWPQLDCSGEPEVHGAQRPALAHAYKAKLVGLQARQHTGWLEDGLYAPHTASAFRAPSNKTLLLLANGLLAKQCLRKARRAGRAPAAR